MYRFLRLTASTESVVLLAFLLFTYMNAYAAPQYNTTCSSCHNMPPKDGATRDPNTGAFVGNHETHLPGSASIGNCAVCHNAVGYTTDHLDRSVSFLTNINGSPGAVYKVQGGIVTFKNQTSVPILGKCSNVNCHFETTTPFWGDAVYSYSSSAINDCSKCHGAPPSGSSPVFYGGAAGTHVKHDEYYRGAAQCKKCHADHVAEANKFAHASSAGNRNLILQLKDPQDASGGTYSGALNDYLPSQANAFGRCSNLYCHSDGKRTTSPYTGMTTARWGGTLGSLGCKACHGGATSNTLSGRHDRHVNNAGYLGKNFGCVDCHSNTVSDDNTISDRSRHVNKFVDYSGLRAGRQKACASIYCHSDGKGHYASIPTWSSTALPSGLACNNCHANTSPSHPTHVTSHNITCDQCHNLTAASSTALRKPTNNHINGTYNVNGVDLRFASFSSSWKATYSSGTKSCSTIYCHSDGRGSYGTVIWGTPLNCNSCHPFNKLTAGHAKHIDTAQIAVFYTYTANRSGGDEGASTAVYRFGCSNCHPLDKATYHTNGVIDVTIRPASGAGSLRNKNVNITADGINVAGSHITKSGGSLTCDNVYCHTNGYAANMNWNNITPVWTGSFTKADRCANCHGNSPNETIAGSPAHKSHTVGIHSIDIFSGKSGKLEAGTGSTAIAVSHGNVSQATTNNCNICHNNTVTYARNDRNSACEDCHTSFVNPAQINNRAFHVNGRVDVAFKPVKIVSKAQLRPLSFKNYTAAGGYWDRNGAPTIPHYKDGGLAYDTAKTTLNNTMWSTGSCSNIACHMGRAVNWNSTLDCVDCHTEL